jgi:predicted dehydrogenase
MQESKLLNIALIGYGYWGKNIARAIFKSLNCELLVIVDTDLQKLAEAQRDFPLVQTLNHHKIILDNSRIDAVVVATPVSQHYAIVKECLKSGKNVLCEKVLALTEQNHRELYLLAKKQALVLMVGFTFLYNNVVKYIKKAIDCGEFGDLYYLTFKRTGLGPIRTDVDVKYDLAAHDLSILIFLLGLPKSLSSVSRRVISTKNPDISFIQARYSSGLIADIQVSWLSPMKQRIIEIVGEKQMMIFDDVNTFDKLRIIKTGKDYQSKVKDFGSFQMAVKDGDIYIPSIPYPEPLSEQIDEFINCILARSFPTENEAIALAVAKALISIQET